MIEAADGGVVTMTVGAVITDVVATLGATSAYGSIGHIWPEGPVANARGGVGLAFGATNVEAGEPELDVVGTVALPPGCFARSGGTTQRPAA